MKKILNILIVFCFALSVKSQDFHFSQYWASPLNLNPALAGVMEDNIRFTANYRSQWFQYSTFSTYAVSMDANLFRNQLNGNFLGLGLGFYQDSEGGGEFKNTGVNLSLGYTQRFGAQNSTHYLGFGIQGTYLAKQINLRNLIYGSLFEFNDNSDPIDFANYNRTSFMDFNAGINYFVNIQDKHSIGGGFAISHIAKPNISFGNNEDDVLYRKYSANMSALFELKNETFSIVPIFLFQKQGPHSEIDFGSYVKFLLDSKNQTSLYLGAQYRLAAYAENKFGGDAVILGLRGEIQSFDLGFSYDITTSDLRNSKTFFGGPELYVIYTIPTSKSRYKEMLNCPKF